LVCHTEGGCRLRVFETRVLRRVFEPKTDELKRQWRRLHKEELYPVFLTKYHSYDQVNKTEIVGACSTYGGEERCIKDFGRDT
jgi:hypothetical protein